MCHVLERALICHKDLKGGISMSVICWSQWERTVLGVELWKSFPKGKISHFYFRFWQRLKSVGLSLSSWGSPLARQSQLFSHVIVALGLRVLMDGSCTTDIGKNLEKQSMNRGGGTEICRKASKERKITHWLHKKKTAGRGNLSGFHIWIDSAEILCRLYYPQPVWTNTRNYYSYRWWIYRILIQIGFLSWVSNTFRNVQTLNCAIKSGDGNTCILKNISNVAKKPFRHYDEVL